MTIVSSVQLSAQRERFDCSISDFTGYPDLVEVLHQHLPMSATMGTLKLRESLALGRAYMSNGCPKCDAIFGRHFEIHTRYDESEVAAFAQPAVTDWGKMVRDLMASDDGHLA